MIYADKIGSELIFWNDEGKKYSYDFKDKNFWSYNVGKVRKKIKSINRFLVKTPVYKVKWVNKAYGSFIEWIRRNEGRCSNIGTFISRMESYIHLEAYFLLGFKTGDMRGVTKSPEFYNKKVLKMFVKHKIPITRSVERAFERNYDFLTDVFFCLDSLYDENRESRFFDEELHNIIYKDESLKELIVEYRYDMKRFLIYLCYLSDYEAMDIGKGIGILRDYARMMSTMQDKYLKYPRNLHTTHDIVIKNFNNAKKKYNNELFRKVIETQYKYEWKYKDYIILVPEFTEDVQNEGCSLRHCVGGYIDSIIEKRTKILFLRNIYNWEESLITLEVRDEKLVEARGFANRQANAIEKNILEKWCKVKNIEYRTRG
jgi:hypothetical protein